MTALRLPICFAIFTLATAKPPVVLIPGFSSSTLEVKLSSDLSALGCPPWHNWTQIYPISKSQASNASYIACVGAVLALTLNPLNKQYEALPGVHIQAQAFGSSDACPFGSKVFQQHGWKDQIDLFGAPYDFRLDPSALATYYSNLKALIENASAINNGSRVNLFANSNGPLIALGFLQTVNTSWKRTYISALFASSPVFSGSVETVLDAVQGNTAKAPGASAALIRDIIDTWPGGLMNMPIQGGASYLYNGSLPVVISPNKNYTSGEIETLLKDLGLGFAPPIYKHVRDDVVPPFKYPGVNTYLFYGYGQHTVNQLVYKEALPDNALTVPKTPSMIYVDGDGLVPTFSNNRTKAEWTPFFKRDTLTLSQHGYKMGHAKCLNDKDCLKQVLDYLIPSSS